jgi:hypothetical protein
LKLWEASAKTLHPRSLPASNESRSYFDLGFPSGKITQIQANNMTLFYSENKFIGSVYKLWIKRLNHLKISLSAIERSKSKIK